jgi:hypothetical protein
VCPAQQHHQQQRFQHFRRNHAAGSPIGAEMDLLLQPGTRSVEGQELLAASGDRLRKTMSKLFALFNVIRDALDDSLQLLVMLDLSVAAL